MGEFEYMQLEKIIESQAARIEELEAFEAVSVALQKQVKELEEYKWMYEDLCE